VDLDILSDLWSLASKDKGAVGFTLFPCYGSVFAGTEGYNFAAVTQIACPVDGLIEPITVDGRSLVQALKLFPGKPHLSVEGKVLVLSDQVARTRLNYRVGSEPVVSTLDEHTCLTVDQKTFLRVLKTLAALTNEVYGMSQTAGIRLRWDGTQLHVQTCDSFRAAWVKLSTIGKSCEPFEIQAPPTDIVAAVGALTGLVRIEAKPGHYLLLGDEQTTIKLATLAVKFPAIETHLAQDFPYRCLIARDDLQFALRAAEVVTAESITLLVDNGTVSLRVVGRELGDAERIVCDADAPDIMIHLSPDYLTGVLAFADLLTIEWSAPMQQVRITGSDYRYWVMPRLL